MAKTQTTTNSGNKLLSFLKPKSGLGKFLMFVIAFALIGGGYYAFKSFAAEAYYIRVFPAALAINVSAPVTPPPRGIASQTNPVTTPLVPNPAKVSTVIDNFSYLSSAPTTPTAINTSHDPVCTQQGCTVTNPVPPSSYSNQISVKQLSPGGSIAYVQGDAVKDIIKDCFIFRVVDPGLTKFTVTSSDGKADYTIAGSKDYKTRCVDNKHDALKPATFTVISGGRVNVYADIKYFHNSSLLEDITPHTGVSGTNPVPDEAGDASSN